MKNDHLIMTFNSSRIENTGDSFWQNDVENTYTEIEARKPGTWTQGQWIPDINTAILELLIKK